MLVVPFQQLQFIRTLGWVVSWFLLSHSFHLHLDGPLNWAVQTRMQLKLVRGSIWCFNRAGRSSECHVTMNLAVTRDVDGIPPVVADKQTMGNTKKSHCTAYWEMCQVRKMETEKFGKELTTLHVDLQFYKKVPWHMFCNELSRFVSSPWGLEPHLPEVLILTLYNCREILR